MENFDSCSGRIHVVEKGDTLYRLSKMYGCNLGDIITANPYVNVYNMQEGEEVCIPVTDKEEADYYEVKDGDTFEDVFMYFGIGPDELFEKNNELYHLMLPAGMKLTNDKNKNQKIFIIVML